MKDNKETIKFWLILPIIAFAIKDDRSKELTIGWLTRTFSITW